MPIYLANDSYEGFLQTTYNPGESVFDVDNVPLNVPTIVVSAPGTVYEAVFTVTGKTINALTGVTRIRGYNGVLVEGTAITCLNNEEFINQYRTYLAIDATFIEDTTNTDTYAGSMADTLLAYTAGLKINLKVTNANTGASSLNIDSLGAKSIKKNVSEDIEEGDIKAGQVIPLVYDGTNFQIVGGGGSGSGDFLVTQVFS